jgi:LacI family transcriptional regulator
MEAGLRVPQDVAFVGYGDDLEEVWFHKIPLTTVRIDSEQMGRQATARLIEEMHTPGREKIVEKLPTELVVRESCGTKGS